jgi:hypothetical protein
MDVNRKAEAERQRLMGAIAATRVTREEVQLKLGQSKEWRFTGDNVDGRFVRELVIGRGGYYKVLLTSSLEIFKLLLCAVAFFCRLCALYLSHVYACFFALSILSLLSYWKVELVGANGADRPGYTQSPAVAAAEKRQANREATALAASKSGRNSKPLSGTANNKKSGASDPPLRVVEGTRGGRGARVVCTVVFRSGELLKVRASNSLRKQSKASRCPCSIFSYLTSMPSVLILSPYQITKSQLSLGQRGSLVRSKDVQGVNATSHNLRALHAIRQKPFLERYK